MFCRGTAFLTDLPPSRYQLHFTPKRGKQNTHTARFGSVLVGAGVARPSTPSSLFSSSSEPETLRRLAIICQSQTNTNSIRPLTWTCPSLSLYPTQHSPLQAHCSSSSSPSSRSPIACRRVRQRICSQLQHHDALTASAPSPAAPRSPPHPPAARSRPKT